MVVFFTIIHVLLCVFMIFVILLQPGKDAGMGAALGGGAATSAFGGRGAVTFLSKLTAVCAGLFFLTSLGLGLLARYQSSPTDILNKLPTTTTGDKSLLDTLGPASESKPEEKPADPNAIPTGGDNTNAATPADASKTEAKPADASATEAKPADQPATEQKPAEAGTATEQKPAQAQ